MRTDQYVAVPTSIDVLCGTGQEKNHTGNEHFKRVVSRFVTEYAEAPSKRDKMRITKSILYLLTDSGVRFLKKSAAHQYWFVAKPKVGRDKIGHFLRLHVPTLKILRYTVKEDVLVLPQSTGKLSKPNNMTSFYLQSPIFLPRQPSRTSLSNLSVSADEPTLSIEPSTTSSIFRSHQGQGIMPGWNSINTFPIQHATNNTRISATTDVWNRGKKSENQLVSSSNLVNLQHDEGGESDILRTNLAFTDDHANLSIPSPFVDPMAGSSRSSPQHDYVEPDHTGMLPSMLMDKAIQVCNELIEISLKARESEVKEQDLFETSLPSIDCTGLMPSSYSHDNRKRGCDSEAHEEMPTMMPPTGNNEATNGTTIDLFDEEDLALVQFDLMLDGLEELRTT